MISYGKCTKAQYEALTPVQDRIYFLTDTGEQFLNGLPYNGEDNKDYLCLTAETDGATVGLKYDATPSAYPIVWHSADRRTWTAFEWTGNVTDVATLANAGDKVYLRAFDGGFGNTAAESTNLKFSMTGTIAASGNVMSLLHGDDFETRSEVPAFGFQNLFRGCASLVEPPEMPATRLGVRAYYCMFYGCALRHCPGLPARTLTQACYGSMFGGGHQQFATAEIGAESFEADPDFPLSEMAPLNKTFKGCASLATVTAHFELWSTTDIGTVATNWLQNTSTTGVFKCPSALDTTTRDASHVPAGWSVIYTDVEAGKTIPSATASDAGKVLTVNSSGNPAWDAAQGGGDVPDATDYLHFTAFGWGATIQLTKYNLDRPDLEYSTDKQTWTTYTWEANEGTTITLANDGDTVWFRGNNDNFSIAYSQYYRFWMSGEVVGAGNIMSLLDKTCRKITVPGSCFRNLFQGCTSLISAPELPALWLGNECYAFMFYGCTNLTSAPKLPATQLFDSCYSGMFYECTSLTSAPELPSRMVASNCYNSMFRGCTSLKYAPELPVTILQRGCYNSMFQGCTSLKYAPELPATTLGNYCYYGMFSGCTSLMSAPELPATTLTNDCYESMFSGCTNIHYVKVGAVDTSAMTNMLSNAGATGVFDCPAGTDPSAILPSGWTVCHNDYDASLEPESFEIPAASTAQLLLPPTRFFQKPNQAVTYTLWHDPAKSIEEVVIVVDMATSNSVSFQDENGNAISYGQGFAVGLIVEFKCVCAGGTWKIVATKLD